MESTDANVGCSSTSSSKPRGEKNKSTATELVVSGRKEPPEHSEVNLSLTLGPPNNNRQAQGQSRSRAGSRVQNHANIEPKICLECGTTQTTLWRKGPKGLQIWCRLRSGERWRQRSFSKSNLEKSSSLVILVGGVKLVFQELDFIILHPSARCWASMIDFIIVEQMKSWMGFIQKIILESVGCIWFKHTESKDREVVTRKLREHTQGVDNNPLLIFPEGTCINNQYTVMFKKVTILCSCLG
ncbi:uncharacterized protein A4U43_C04F17300 [Asparagus officinalis]|uniref:GATA-type domain-containing protein n=1 Tax=Asparagus officinalis TaxID=4686 RepID=A0A5P1F6W7_ASPOF|nr:uncharacterized protein A4U43_C04F17300 [Asparagus officinalis]